jgi:hypothetical protein
MSVGRPRDRAPRGPRRGARPAPNRRRRAADRGRCARTPGAQAGRIRSRRIAVRKTTRPAARDQPRAGSNRHRRLRHEGESAEHPGRHGGAEHAEHLVHLGDEHPRAVTVARAQHPYPEKGADRQGRGAGRSERGFEKRGGCERRSAGTMNPPTRRSGRGRWREKGPPRDAIASPSSATERGPPERARVRDGGTFLVQPYLPAASEPPMCRSRGPGPPTSHEQ